MRLTCAILLIVTALLWVPSAAAQVSAEQAQPAAEREDALELTRDERRQIQSALADAGFYTGTINGLFGRQTRAAIRAWQASHGEPETGYLDADGAIALLEAGTAPEGEAGPEEPAQPLAARDQAQYLSSGLAHTCALREDGSPVCWGVEDDDVDAGQAEPPRGERFVSISSGAIHTCGLREDGTAVCWGTGPSDIDVAGDAGQADPPHDERFVSISSGAMHTCALREDGSAVCWGAQPGMADRPQPDERFVSISSGAYHTCALREDGSPSCWGWQLIMEAGVIDAPRGERFASISSGAFHTCGLREDGRAVCWGLREDLDIDGIPIDVSVPDPPREERFVSVSSGWFHACGLREAGTAVCWGAQDSLMDMGQADPPRDERFVAISAGALHTCGLRDDRRVVCWGSEGDEDYGQANPPAGERFAVSGVDPDAPSPPHTTAPDDDHSDERDGATELTTSVRGRIDTDDDEDYFRIEIPHPANVTIYTTGTLDTLGILWIGTDVSVGDDDGAGDGRNFLISMPLEAGTHYASVRGDESATGSYTIHLEAEADDHGDSILNATVLMTSVAGRIERGDDLDYFEIDIEERAQVTMYTTGSLDTVGRLEDGLGTEITSNDDFDDDTNFRFSQTLDPDIYYLRVASYGSETGRYTVHLAVTQDHADERDGATELTTSVEGTIETEGDVDYFRVEIPERIAVTIHTTGDLDTLGRLEDQSGAELDSDDDGGEGSNFRVSAELDPGTYYVSVTGDASATGRYTVHLHTAEIAPPLSLPLDAGEQLSSGGYHTCGLRADGTAVCWGDDGEGQASPPAGERYASISSGYRHTCGLRADGTAVCWGYDRYGQASPPAGERYASLSSGGFHTCGLRADGTAVCWGSDGEGWASPPAGERYASLSSGGGHTCGLRADGTAVCWGYDEDGQASPPAGERYASISSGGGHTCGLRGDGTAVCWGYDGEGWASPPAGERYASLSSGGGHTCGLRADGTAVCWGSDGEGWASPPAGERYASLSSGGGHTCGLRVDGMAVCWGYDESGQASPPAGERFAIGRPDAGATPQTDDHADDRAGATELTTSVEGTIESAADVDYFRIEIPDRSYVTIHTTGSLDTVGVVERETAAGSIEQIAQESDGGEGQNFRIAGPAEPGTYYLQVSSDGSETANYTVHLDVSPALSLPMSPGEQISGTARHTCALRADGSAVCWGSNRDGQAAAPAGERFVAIGVGGSHTCALRADGAPVCWGSGYAGESTPPAGERFVAISTGGQHTCGLRQDGTATCWGSNVFGRATPPAAERFTAISSGSQHTCALRPDGSPVCWGHDRYGRATPPTGERLAAISSGGEHGCALRADGAAVCWGSNEYGQATPPADERFTSIHAGWQHTCGLRLDGGVVCWGRTRGDTPAGERFASISSGGGYSCGVRLDGSALCWGAEEVGRATPPAGERFSVAGRGILSPPDAHGDAPVEATELITSVEGQIAPGDDLDYFRVDLPHRAEVTLHTTGSLDTVGVLQAETADGSVAQIASADDGGEAGNFRIWQVLEPGTYYLMVSSQGAATGSYTVHLSTVEIPPDDHGDVPGEATALATSVGGRIETGADVDYFGLSIERPADVTLSTTGSLDTLGVLERQAADGTVERIAEAGAGGEGRNFRIAAAADAGTYYVRVASRGSETGAYTVHVEVREPPSDLLIAAVELPDTVTTGQRFDVSVAVRNAGRGEAGSTIVQLHRSEDATITAADRHEHSVPLARQLAAGEERPVEATLSASGTPGRYHYGACVDPVPGESDTENNCSTAEVVTVVLPPAPAARCLSPCESPPVHGIDGTGRADASAAVTLRWEIFDGTELVRFFFGDTPDPPRVGSERVSGGRTFEHTRPLHADTQYWWRVDTLNGDGAVTEGDLWTFSTVPQAGAATGPEPADGATGVALNPTFRWTPGAYGKHSLVCISPDRSKIEDADLTVCHRPDREGELRFDNDFGSKQLWWIYWQVRTYNAFTPMGTRGELWRYRTCFLPRCVDAAVDEVIDDMIEELYGD